MTKITIAIPRVADTELYFAFIYNYRNFSMGGAAELAEKLDKAIGYQVASSNNYLTIDLDALDEGLLDYLASRDQATAQVVRSAIQIGKDCTLTWIPATHPPQQFGSLGKAAVGYRLT